MSISEEGDQALAWLALHTHEELPAIRCQHPFPTPINMCISGSPSTAGSANRAWSRRRKLIERTQICIFHAALSPGINCNNSSTRPVHVHSWNMQIEPLITLWQETWKCCTQNVYESNLKLYVWNVVCCTRSQSKVARQNQKKAETHT